MTPPDHHLPATLKPGALTTLTDSSHLVPALIADAGEPAPWRYIDFFTPTSATRTRAGLTRGPATNSSPGARIAG
jgi:hypothetical protein